MLGEVVGNYRITEVIGSGGMGEVYRAEHVLLGKQAAVKVLRPERTANAELVERFFNEARASTLVQHPGIVDIFDYGTMANGAAYIVMELLEGETLGVRLKRRGQLPAADVVSIATHIASVLHAAHKHGIIHRDLKPDNVFLVADPALPNGERAKVLDFGIAKLSADIAQDAIKTQTGTLMGTPYYMSPEQCRGAGAIDHRSDIYSLGCVMYQMLCGRPPFVMEGSGEVLAAHIHVPPPRPRSVSGASIPAQLELVLLQMLAKNPADRFWSMQDVVVALNQATPAPRSAAVPAAAYAEPDSAPVLAYNLRTHSTTLGSTSAEYTTLDREHSRWHHWAIQVAVAGVVVAGAWFGLRAAGRAGNSTEARPAAVASNAPDPADATPAAAAEKPQVMPLPFDRGRTAAAGGAAAAASKGAPASASQVVLSIRSRPSGARVYREADGVYVGRTPVAVTEPRGSGRAVFILRRSGYHHARLSIPVERNQVRTIDLRRHRVHTRPAHRHRAAAHAHAARAVKAAKPTRATQVKPPATATKRPAHAPKTLHKPGKNDAINPFSDPPADPSGGATGAK